MTPQPLVTLLPFQAVMPICTRDVTPLLESEEGKAVGYTVQATLPNNLGLGSTAERFSSEVYAASKTKQNMRL